MKPQEKINLSDFNKNKLLARLYAINRNFSSKYDSLIEAGKSAFMAEVESIVNDNFVFPENQKTSVVNNLALHILGNTNNVFDKMINN